MAARLHGRSDQRAGERAARSPRRAHPGVGLHRRCRRAGARERRAQPGRAPRRLAALGPGARPPHERRRPRHRRLQQGAGDQPGARRRAGLPRSPLHPVGPVGAARGHPAAAHQGHDGRRGSHRPRDAARLGLRAVACQPGGRDRGLQPGHRDRRGQHQGPRASRGALPGGPALAGPLQHLREDVVDRQHRRGHRGLLSAHGQAVLRGARS